MSLDHHLAAGVERAGLPPELAAQLTARLARGAAEYGNRSLSRPRAELLGEMLEEALDLIGWAIVAERATAGQRSESHAVALRVRLHPVVHQAGAIAGYLAAVRDEALELATPNTEPA